MSINIKTTKDLRQNGVKILSYGATGVGKTRLIPTLPSPVALSAEGGLLSISDSNVTFIEISTADDLTEACQWLTESDEAKKFESVAIDSITEIAEVVLTAEKKKTKDPRKAYGEMQDQLAEKLREFRDLPKHIYMTAQLDKVQDDQGRILNGPSMPGNKIGQRLPYFFDELFAIRKEKDPEGHDVTMIQTSGDMLWAAKDRSGKLDMWTPYEVGLGGVISTIMGES